MYCQLVLIRELHPVWYLFSRYTHILGMIKLVNKGVDIFCDVI